MAAVIAGNKHKKPTMLRSALLEFLYNNLKAFESRNEGKEASN